MNEFQYYSRVILSQPYFPNIFAVANYYRKLHGGEPGLALNLDTTYRKGIVSNGEITYEVRSIRTMQDKRLRPIYERMRWAEMYQAAHRVRPILFPRGIEIIFAIPIDGLPANKILYRISKEWDKLIEAAITLLSTQGEFTRDDLATISGVSIRTVKKHWSILVNEMELEIVAREKSSSLRCRLYPVELSLIHI